MCVLSAAYCACRGPIHRGPQGCGGRGEALAFWRRHDGGAVWCVLALFACERYWLIHPVLPSRTQDSASRAPSGRRWSDTSRRLSWIRCTRLKLARRRFAVLACCLSNNLRLYAYVSLSNALDPGNCFIHLRVEAPSSSHLFLALKPRPRFCALACVIVCAADAGQSIYPVLCNWVLVCSVTCFGQYKWSTAFAFRGRQCQSCRPKKRFSAFDGTGRAVALPSNLVAAVHRF